MTILGVLAGLSLAVWIVLILARGGFWRADQRLDGGIPDREIWPDVVAVIPARNEAPTIGRTVASLLNQDYPGRLRVVVVDDNSDDGTANAACLGERVTVVDGKPLEEGWSGKMWALHQGLAAAREPGTEPRYILLTDADIEHAPANLRHLVNKAEWESLDLTSLMVRLRCESLWERLLIPAFVFFFQKLYPFPRVNDPDRATAGAAGGCMLVRGTALERIGGVESIRDALIDDCALAARIKEDGPIWLGLTGTTRSLRAYETLAGIWRMVARTAFVQLGYSTWLLLGTVLGMVVIYALPPLAVGLGAAWGDAFALGWGFAAWLLMSIAYIPTLKLYARPAWTAVLLPVAAVLYTLMTIDSARRHWLGQGGTWKGRSYTGG